jgi:Tfp pilus assembly protein PilN
MRPINLLPPEAAEKAAARRRVAGLALLGVLYLGLLVVGYLYFRGQADQAEEARDQQFAVNEDLRQQIVALAPVAALNAEFEQKSEQVGEVLAVDVAWGRLLNDLARVIPDRVWLDGLAASVQVQEDQPGFGTVQMTGVAFDYPDAATWLRTLDSDQWPAIGAGWVLSTTSEEVVDGVQAVNFSSVGTLTNNALSNRAEERIPEVPGQ